MAVVATTRICSTCRRPFTPKTTRQRHCSTSCRDRMLGARKRAKGGKAKYGYEHKKTRAQWKPHVERGEVACWRCRHPIHPGRTWDLGHVPDGTRLPEHSTCNRSAGATEGNHLRAQPFTSSPPRIAR